MTARPPLPGPVDLPEREPEDHCSLCPVVDSVAVIVGSYGDGLGHSHLVVTHTTQRARRTVTGAICA